MLETPLAVCWHGNFYSQEAGFSIVTAFPFRFVLLPLFIPPEFIADEARLWIFTYREFWLMIAVVFAKTFVI